MKLQALAAASALLLLVACDSTGTDGSNASGSGYDANGKAIPGTSADLSTNVGDRVFYAYDSSVLTSEAQSTLQRQADWLKQYSNVNVVIEGHCDERGTREYNLALGERRAAAAKSFLLSLGVDSNRVSTISYGKERAAVVGHDDSAWSQNRRAVTVIAN
jgi:peptidoglycan-associated lipoprotein